MALGSQLRRPTLLAATLALLAAFSASPARADRCEDIAKELKSQIDGVKVSVNTGKMIYLSHPAARELSLGCRGSNYSNELYAKADRKPKPEFFNARITSAAADHLHHSEVRRADRHLALHQAHGPSARRQDSSMRFRRLNMECTRTKKEASIVVTRGKDE